MLIEPAADHLGAQLGAAADPDFAKGQQAFFQHEVDTWGVRTAALHAIARDLYREVKNWSPAARNKLFEELWKSGKLEEGAIVCYVYRRFARQCGRCEWKLFERWLDRYVSNWANCDGLSTWLLAACIDNDPSLKDELPHWTQSRNRWKRRASAVALLHEGKKGRSLAAVFDIATRLMLDPDDMVQKGVGWLLKETYPPRPHEVVEFLMPWRERAPRLILRYAAEKMLDDDRARVLGGKARRAVRA
jgi:3-methyladenine DNA glycosylase AlkD